MLRMLDFRGLGRNARQLQKEVVVAWLCRKYAYPRQPDRFSMPKDDELTLQLDTR